MCFRKIEFSVLIPLFLCLLFVWPLGVYGATTDVTVEVVYVQCNDGDDNDSDGLTDYPNDPGCTDPGDDNETDPQCLDGLDNDSDGLVDYPDDTGCTSLTDDDETDPVTPVATSTGGTLGGGTSRGGLLVGSNAQEVIFTGLAHSGSRILLLRDGFLAGGTTAKADASFEMVLPNVTPGLYIFTLYGIDKNGVRSGMASFSVNVPQSQQVLISNIFIPPTAAIGSRLTGHILTGMTVPKAKVVVSIDGPTGVLNESEIFADEVGVYTEGIALNGQLFRVYASAAGLISPFSRSLRGLLFQPKVLVGDFNSDGRVNIIDFSMAAFWYEKLSSPSRFDLSGDGAVDLVDLSIMISNWTG